MLVRVHSVKHKPLQKFKTERNSYRGCGAHKNIGSTEGVREKKPPVFILAAIAMGQR